VGIYEDKLDLEIEIQENFMGMNLANKNTR